MSNMLRQMKKQKQKQGETKRVKTAWESYNEGFINGIKEGKVQGYLEGNKRANDIFCDALETLQQLEGIGPKRYQAILKHFGYKDRSELSKENRWKD